MINGALNTTLSMTLGEKNSKTVCGKVSTTEQY